MPNLVDSIVSRRSSLLDGLEFRRGYYMADLVDDPKLSAFDRTRNGSFLSISYVSDFTKIVFSVKFGT